MASGNTFLISPASIKILQIKSLNLCADIKCPTLVVDSPGIFFSTYYVTGYIAAEKLWLPYTNIGRCLNAGVIIANM